MATLTIPWRLGLRRGPIDGAPKRRLWKVILGIVIAIPWTPILLALYAWWSRQAPLPAANPCTHPGGANTATVLNFGPNGKMGEPCPEKDSKLPMTP
jgi:hypothetical protein